MERSATDAFSNFQITVSFAEAFGREADLGYLCWLLKQYNRTDVLMCLAKLNCLLETWRRGTVDTELDERIATKLFSADVVRRVKRASGDLPKRIFFPKLSILAALKLALQVCSNEAPRVEPVDVGQLFTGCLILNDLIPGRPAGSSTEDMIAHLLPLYDYTPRSSFEADACRSLYMFEDVAPGLLRSRPGEIDWSRAFAEAFGADARTFAEFCFAIAAQYLKLNEENLAEKPGLFFIEPNYFSETRIAATVLNRFVRRFSISEGDLSNMVRELEARPLGDLTPLQLHPLIRLEDGRMYCLDVNFLLDKAGRGLYWSLRNAAPTALHKRLPGSYGNLFNAYVNTVFRSTTLKTGSYEESPRFANGDEAFDGCIQEGSRIVVFEFKSSVLRADIKYGGDPAALMKEIDGKFVRGDRDGPKGVAQLSAGILKWLNGSDLNIITRDAVRVIYPVIVVLERAMTVPWMAEYLNEGLRAAIPSRVRGKTITRLYVIDIENLERMTPYLEHVRFSDMLDSYFDAHVRHIRRVEYAVKPENIPIISDIKPSASIIESRFHEFRRGMFQHLFGVETDLPEQDGTQG